MKKMSLACWIWFSGVLAALLLSSAAVVWIPYVTFDPERGNPVFAYLCGAAFWGFLLIGYGLFIGLALATKKLRKKGDRVWGVFRAFSNPEAIVADVLLMVSLVAFVILRVMRVQNALLVCITLAVLLLSAHLHGILNGNVYRYMRGQSRK